MSAGVFDTDLAAAGWFDPDLITEAWYDRDLVSTAPAGTAFTVNINDTSTLSDAIGVGYGKGLADTGTPTDNVAFDFGKGLADTETPSDALALGPGLSLADSTTATDSVTPARGLNVQQDDSATTSDALAFGPGLGLSDTLAPNDAQGKDVGKVLADSSAPTDSLSLEPGLNLADSVTTSDNATAARGLNIAPSDSATATDAVALGPGLGIDDTLAPNDAQGKDVGKVLADSTSVSDSAAASLVYFANVNDSATTSDSVSFGYGPGMSDSVTTSDSQAFDYGKAVADSLGISDAQAFGIGKAIADTTSISDSASAIVVIAVQVDDSVTAIDSQVFSYGIGVNDSSSPTDSLSLSPGLVIADSVTLADARSLAFGKSLSDSLAPFDSIVTSQAFALPISDTVSPSDLILVSQGFNVSLGDSVSLADHVDAYIVGAAAPYTHTFLPDTIPTTEVLTGSVFEVSDTGLVSPLSNTGLITSIIGRGTPVDYSTDAVLPTDFARATVEEFVFSLRDKPLTTDNTHIPDTTGPRMTITTPLMGETIFGHRLVKAIPGQPEDEIAGPTGMFLVAFRTDTTGGAPDHLIYAPGPYSYILDTVALGEGTHTIYVRGEDTAENVGPDESVTFTVDNTAYLASTDPEPIRGYGYHKVFEENFDGPTINRDVWTNKIWYDGDPNPDWTDFQTIETDGCHLRSRREWSTLRYVDGVPSWTGPPFPNNTMTTQNSFQFQYGYVEARMKWTDGMGSWPGFWLYSHRHATNPDFPDPNHYCATNGLDPEFCVAGEIDIFEGQGGPTLIGGTPPLREWYFGTIHRNSASPAYGIPDNQRPNPNSFNTGGTNLTADFHVYSCLWKPDEIIFYLDGNELGRALPFASLQQPMFLLIQEWIGGWSWPISPAPDTPDLLETVWDYVRVWQL